MPGPEADVASEPGDDADNEQIVSGLSHPEWSPLVTEAQRRAGRVILRRMDRGETLTQRDMDVERTYQRALLEHRGGATPQPAAAAANTTVMNTVSD